MQAVTSEENYRHSVIKVMNCKAFCEDEIISMSRAWDKHRAGALSTELRRTHGERGHILGSYLTRVLHNAWISNIEIVLYGERMKDGKFYSR